MHFRRLSNDGHVIRDLCLIAVAVLSLFSCDRPGNEPGTQATIVLYTSVDEPVARPIVDAFAKETGIAVTLVTDTEATKSVGLAQRLRAEKNQPRCDVWWGNEPFHTAQLSDEGLFAPYASPSANDVRPTFRDPQHRWAGNGLRARVIAKPEAWKWARLSVKDAQSLDDLLDPSLKNKIVMGRPALGTIGGHVAAIYATRGQAAADAFFMGLRNNGVTLVGGNGPVPQGIAAGHFFAGLTDNDDVAATNAGGAAKVQAVLPDQAEGQPGTLAIPTTVALVVRAKDNAAARQLVDRLLSAEVEKALIAARFAGWSVRAAETEFRAMPIDYAEVAGTMPRAVRRAEAILEGRPPAE
ncbi:MAG TPA: extracellular solute-binding protein [Tepidisphaeraceae bacterium]|jgi:iron(III) transport system substrate-binding protein